MGSSPRLAGLTLIVAATICSAGCFRLSSVLTIKSDGSGTIQQHVLFTPAGLAQLRGLATLGGGRGQAFDPISEQQARAAAGSMGPGVTYVSSTPIKTDEGEGRDITYAFTDVTQVRIAPTPPAPGGVSLGGPGAGTVSFQISQQPDGNTLLRIIEPNPSAPNGAAGGAAPGQGPSSMLGRLPLDQMAMFKSMLAGARLTIAVEPAGRLVRTSSPYADGTRVTLLDVDLDQLLMDDTLLPRLQAAQSPEKARAILDRVPGLKVSLDPEITIEFAPAK